jgi:ABC-type transport system involved in multi-copper enzyme maturation permease subunit
MLKTLIRKEIIETILDLRFVIAALLCIVLIPLGMYVSLKDYEQRLQEYQTSVQQYEQRGKETMFSGDFGAEGYRPPSPLSVFSSGLKDKLNMKVTTQYDGNYYIENLSQDENPQAVLFGKIDFAFIVGTVLSLLALIFTFRTVTGEKESGTLRLVIAGSVPRWKIIFSKIVGGYCIFLIPVLLSFTFGLLFLNRSEILSLSAQHYGTIFLILVITLLFLFCIFSMGVLVSVLTHSSIMSMICVLFAWVLLILVIPKTSPMIAQMVCPVQSRQVVDTEKALVLGEIRKEKEKAEAELYKKVLADAGLGLDRAFDDSKETERAQKQYDKQKEPVLRKYEERMSKEARRIEENYTNQRRAQVVTAANLSRLSPICCFTYALSEMAGTGTSEIENFSKQARQFQETMKRNYYDNFEFSEYRTDNQWSGGYYRKEGFDLDKFPVPHMSSYRHVGLAGALSVCWWDIVLLILFSVLFFAGAFVSFLRYDVR